jgi:transcription-repair coupling factor (superfamily II helicase)
LSIYNVPTVFFENEKNNSLENKEKNNKKILIEVNSLSAGFKIFDIGLIIISEGDLFGTKIKANKKANHFQT